MRNCKKYCATLAFAVSVIVFLPEAAFAKGAVVGYAHGNVASTLTDTAQLDYLTHVIVGNLRPDRYGNVVISPSITKPNWENVWLKPYVKAAHRRGVKVSIGISGPADSLVYATQADNNGNPRK